MPISSERGDAPLWCMRQNDSHGNPRPLRGITRSCATTFLRSSMLRRFDSRTSSPQQHVVVINTNMTTIIQTAPGFLLPHVQNTCTESTVCPLRCIHYHMTICSFNCLICLMWYAKKQLPYTKGWSTWHKMSSTCCSYVWKERTPPGLPVPVFISCRFLTEPFLMFY